MKKPPSSALPRSFREDHELDVRALRKPAAVEAANRDFDIRCSLLEGQYERAMVAAALREAEGRKE